MNINAYDLDSLRGLVRRLQAENKNLRELLAEKHIPVDESDVFHETAAPNDYDPDQAARIIPFKVTDDLARKFFGLFWGRTDVYAKRGAKGGYYPQCKNRWVNGVCPKLNGTKTACDDCADRQWEPLGLQAIKQHLIGWRENCTDVIGVYPLFPDNTCRFLAFDFDNHEKGADQIDNANTDESWRDEVDALRQICSINGIDALTERSRSGRGAHVWIFFKHPIPASLARNFGYALLDRGCESINLTSFRFYDRMFPAQSTAERLGNLIVLPLQGRALKNGNSAFIDEAWNAYPDQLEIMDRVRRLSKKDVEEHLVQWAQDRGGYVYIPNIVNGKERLKPWRRNDAFHPADVTGLLHIVLADGVYVDALNLSPRIQNQIRCLATIDNPEFYKRERAKRSNYYYLSTIYLGKDTEGFIQIPRGLLETLITKCQNAGIPYDIEDHRTTGKGFSVLGRCNVFCRRRINDLHGSPASLLQKSQISCLIILSHRQQQRLPHKEVVSVMNAIY